MQCQTQFCSNCHKNIQISKFLIHQAYCLRYITYCQLCKSQYNTNQKAHHYQNFHLEVLCKICSSKYEIKQQSSHLMNCRPKIIFCQYCLNHFEQKDSKHDKVLCSFKTEKCDNCFKYIKRCELKNHSQICLEKEIINVQEEKDIEIIESQITHVKSYKKKQRKYENEKRNMNPKQIVQFKDSSLNITKKIFKINHHTKKPKSSVVIQIDQSI